MAHNAAIQHSYSAVSVITGHGPHIVRSYPKAAGAIPAGSIVSLPAGGATRFDPAADPLVPVKGVAIREAADTDTSVMLCVFGQVRQELLTVSDGTPPDAADLALMEDRHIYAVEEPYIG